MSVVLEKELPRGWAYAKLEEIAMKLKAGGTPSTKVQKYYVNGNIPFVKIDDITSSNKYLDQTIISITNEGLENCSAWLVPKNSILYSMYASYGIPIINRIDVATSQAIIALIPYKELTNLDFVYYYLLFIKSNLKPKGTTQGNLNAEIIRNIKILLSPLNEQKRIVAKIEELFSLVDSAKENLEKTKLLLKQYRQSILKHAFEGKLTEELRTENKTSNQWQILSLDQVSDVIDPHPSHRAPPEEFEGFPFVGIGDIDENGNINLKNCRKVPEKFISQQEKSYEIKDGSIGYARVGTVGKVVKLKKHNFRYSLSPTLSIINSKENIFPKFLFYQLQSNLFFQQVRTNLTGTTRDAIGITKLRKIQVYIPSLNEQKKIATKIEESFSIIEKNEKLVDSLLLQYSQIKNSILKQAFEGKLVPQDPNDEPAQILLERIQQERKKNGK